VLKHSVTLQRCFEENNANVFTAIVVDCAVALAAVSLLES
jgi:hypothetical protein